MVYEEITLGAILVKHRVMKGGTLREHSLP